MLPNGLILQLHPITSLLWASNAFNDRGIAIEFVGNFPTEKGIYSGLPNTAARADPGAGQLGPERHLANTVDVGFVFAHRQGYATGARLAGNPSAKHSAYDNERSDCPGPDIWYNVGEWALSELKLDDGGYRLMDGDTIPDSWRKPRT